MKRFFFIIVLLSLFLLSRGVHAGSVRLSGFGSIVGGQTLSDEDLPGGGKSVFQVDPTLTGFPDAAYDDTKSFRPDSNFALQIDSDLGDDLSITVQLTARGGNNFEIEAEWLYATYALSPQFTAAIGRQRLPFYMYSNFLDLGYAYHWIRPPVEVYGEGVSTYEGLSGLYKGFVGDWDYELMAYIGAIHNKTAVIGDITLDLNLGLNVTFSNDWLKLRASYNDAEAWVNGAPIMDKDNPQDIIFYSLGFSVDRMNYFVISEITILEADKYAQFSLPPSFVTIGFRESWMVSMGMRFNTITPHITFSGRDTTLTGHSVPFLDDLVQGAETVNVGLRWDFHYQAAFKVDYTSAKDKSDKTLIALNGKTLQADVIAFGIDFVF